MKSLSTLVLRVFTAILITAFLAIFTVPPVKDVGKKHAQTSLIAVTATDNVAIAAGFSVASPPATVILQETVEKKKIQHENDIAFSRFEYRPLYLQRTRVAYVPYKNQYRYLSIRPVIRPPSSISIADERS